MVEWWRKIEYVQIRCAALNSHSLFSILHNLDKESYIIRLIFDTEILKVYLKKIKYRVNLKNRI